MVTNQNEQSFTYDHSDYLSYGNMSGIESFDSRFDSDCSRFDSFVFKKENGKRSFADVSPTKIECKRSKQAADLDSDSPSPSIDDEVACCNPLDSSWFNLDSPIWVPTFPSYYDCPTVTRSSNVKPACSPFREFSPVRELSPVHDDPVHKPVAIGPNHQADIPEWTDQSDDYSDDKSEYWIRDCVTSARNIDSSLNHKIECDCIDEGSIQCVKMHVSEAREMLMRELGFEKFEKLGFCDMGEEDVAQKWSEEEERLFQEVVSCNPKSMDKNFWDELPEALPNRSSSELVSYYFNVFMLRKRAGQNRFDPTHVDSDDDEWLESQIDSPIEEEEQQEEEEEEDQEDGSGVESGSDRDESLSNRDFIREGKCEEESCFGFGGEMMDDGQNDSCTSFEENLNCENRMVDGFGITLNDELKTWGDYCTDKKSSSCTDDFLSMDCALEEFVGMENWDLGEI